MAEPDIPTFPAAGWELKTVREYKAVLMRLEYLVSAEQPVEAPHRTPYFVFQPALLRELAQALLRAADQAESGGAQKS